MFLDEHTLKDAANLPFGHPAYWLEATIKASDVLGKKDIHDAEHEAQLIKWGCNPKHTSKLSIRIVDGEAFSDRLYHCMLHLKYWKEEGHGGKKAEAVQKFEEQFNFNLDDLTLPSPNAAGHEAY